jgi:hypothetical protein
MHTTSWFRRSLLPLAVLGVAFVAGRSIAYQPHMQNAFAALQSAQSELQQAEPNKGGHRERAMGLVNQAMYEVQEGIKFAGGN